MEWRSDRQSIALQALFEEDNIREQHEPILEDPLVDNQTIGMLALITATSAALTAEYKERKETEYVDPLEFPRSWAEVMTVAGEIKGVSGIEAHQQYLTAINRIGRAYRNLKT